MTSDRSSEKVKEISEILYKETLLPAKEESEKIIADAKEVAAKVIHEAKKESEKIIEKARKLVSEERKVHEASIEVAVKQSIATIKSEIMQVFKKELFDGLGESLKSEEICSSLLNAMVDGINKEGISSDLKLYVSNNLDFDQLSKNVLSKVKGRLEKGEMALPSGLALLIEDKKFTLKTTAETCMKIVADNLSEVLRAKVFV